jgi:hypothetical protein
LQPPASIALKVVSRLFATCFWEHDPISRATAKDNEGYRAILSTGCHKCDHENAPEISV